ncbi:MAG: hypothetical protein HY811_10145 [Planctomycetes bacterium]|nr:hypothetical protein [Planctomycetota bacterium]
MSKNRLVVSLILLVIAMLLIANINCATILDGTKKPHERGNVQFGYVVLDLLTSGGLWLIIDFADGAIYARKSGYGSGLEQDLKDYASGNTPCYVVRNDGCYKVEVINGCLNESKVAKNEISPLVWETIEKEKAQK